MWTSEGTETEQGKRKDYVVCLFKRFCLSSYSFPWSCVNMGKILHLCDIKTNQPLNMFRDEILTWTHPVSAARGFSAEPPSWPSHPRTLASSPPALYTAPPSSASFVHGVAPATVSNIKNTESKESQKQWQEAFIVARCKSLSLNKSYWTSICLNSFSPK